MFKPLLAAPADVDALRYPLMASPKIDGIRCLLMDGGVCSRTLKLIPNLHIRSMLASAPVGYDGELLTYTGGVRDEFNTVQSKVMRRDGEPEFKLLVFDNFNATMGFAFRHAHIHNTNFIERVEHVVIDDLDELDAYEADCVDRLGWEGIMLRDPNGKYKRGRSTVREQILLKVKRFTDDEATITGTVEQMENTNEAKTNVFGRTERSSAKAGMVGKDTLGALQCIWNGIEFDIGTGFNQDQRDKLWSKRLSLVGQKVTFKFQGVGSLGAPRFPVFLHIRHDI